MKEEKKQDSNNKEKLRKINKSKKISKREWNKK